MGMRKEQAQMVEFMKLVPQDTPENPTWPEKLIRELRVKLIAEELSELAQALHVEFSVKTKSNWCAVTHSADLGAHILTNEQAIACLVDTYDALLDLLYVVIGSAVAYGVPLSNYVCDFQEEQSGAEANWRVSGLQAAKSPSIAALGTREARQETLYELAQQLSLFAAASHVDLELTVLKDSVNLVVADKLHAPGEEKENGFEIGIAYVNLVNLTFSIISAATLFGMKLQPGWDEVHRSNMSKFIDGYRREDGKYVKGPSYSPANLRPIILEQMGLTSLA